MRVIIGNMSDNTNVNDNRECNVILGKVGDGGEYLVILMDNERYTMALRWRTNHTPTRMSSSVFRKKLRV